MKHPGTAGRNSQSRIDTKVERRTGIFERALGHGVVLEAEVERQGVSNSRVDTRRREDETRGATDSDVPVRRGGEGGTDGESSEEGCEGEHC